VVSEVEGELIRGTRCLGEERARRVRADAERGRGRSRRVADKAQESSHSTHSTAQAESRGGRANRLWAIDGIHVAALAPALA
jgi:hypothetical protein